MRGDSDGGRYLRKESCREFLVELDPNLPARKILDRSDPHHLGHKAKLGLVPEAQRDPHRSAENGRPVQVKERPPSTEVSREARTDPLGWPGLRGQRDHSNGISDVAGSSPFVFHDPPRDREA